METILEILDKGADIAEFLYIPLLIVFVGVVIWQILKIRKNLRKMKEEKRKLKEAWFNLFS